jgi:prevent-host-death family protein
MSISQLNRNGSHAVRSARRHGQVAITDHGQTVAFLMSAEKVEAILETLEILADPAAMEQLREYQAGRLELKDVSCLED